MAKNDLQVHMDANINIIPAVLLRQTAEEGEVDRVGRLPLFLLPGQLWI